MKQFILKIPEGTNAEDFSEELQDAVKSVNGSFPAGRVIGSQTVDGYDIKLVMANADKVSLDSMFELLSLDWDVLAEEGEPNDESLILPYLIDKSILDEDGEQISLESQSIDYLQTFAGHKWEWL